jgi:putative nucleotidyltransferase-like protein
MARHSSALLKLCECLRGSLPAQVDWVSLLGLANETLTTPTLIDFVDHFEREIPADVRAYVRHLYRRNLVRNGRLAIQLDEAVVALNEQGLIPVLLKGTAMLARAPSARRGSRLMCDLDLLVKPDEVNAAISALAGIGYALHFQTPAGNEKSYADLKRPQDVGMIDLQQAPPGHAYFYRPAGDVLGHCCLTSTGRGWAYVPTPTYQALILIIHDQFQDYDYWVGEIDVRHLVQLRDLANSAQGIDWDQLASFVPSKLARNALESQLVALTELFGVDVPLPLRRRLVPRLQFRRRLVQARFPFTRWLLLPIAVLDYGNYRKGIGAQYRPGRLVGGLWSPPRLGTLRYISGLAGVDRDGKV